MDSEGTTRPSGPAAGDVHERSQQQSRNFSLPLGEERSEAPDAAPSTSADPWQPDTPSLVSATGIELVNDPRSFMNPRPVPVPGGTRPDSPMPSESPDVRIVTDPQASQNPRSIPAPGEDRPDSPTLWDSPKIKTETGPQAPAEPTTAQTAEPTTAQTSEESSYFHHDSKSGKSRFMAQIGQFTKKLLPQTQTAERSGKAARQQAAPGARWTGRNAAQQNQQKRSK
ncbi:hypothetical protein ACWD5R_11835 [Streptomyces sp. NPDC002514]|uniref:hypothetical protein n=1 Tax=Streptomyces sp. NPDC001270 TaxID=3364554 RepID=UPI003680DC47